MEERKREKSDSRIKLENFIHENEASANIATAWVLLTIAGVYILFGVLFAFKVFWNNRSPLPTGNVLIIFGSVMIALSLLALVKKGKGRYLKYVLIFFLMFAAFALNVLIGYKLWIVLTLPVILTGRYYDRKYTVLMGIVAAFLAVCTSYCNAYLTDYTGLLDLNTVSFAEPGILAYDQYLHNAILEKGFDQHRILRNSLKLSSIPNCIVIILVTVAVNSFIHHAQMLMDQVRESSRKESELSQQMKFYLSSLVRIYPFATFMDYSSNYFELIKYDSGVSTNLLQSGSLDGFILNNVGSIPRQDHKEEYLRCFDRLNVLQAYRDGKKEIFLRHLSSDKDGEVSWMETRVLLSENADGTIVGLHFTRCVDDELNAETQADMVLHSVMDDLVVLIDVDLTTEKEIQYFISSKEKLPKWSEGQLYQDCTRDYAEKLIVPEDRARFLDITELENMKRLLSIQPEVNIEYDVLLDGKKRRFQGHFTRGENVERPHMYIGIRDITEVVRNRLEEERKLKEAKAEAEEANRAKSSFLFSMSHDIRTPMNAILGFTYLLENHLEDASAPEYVEKIKLSGEYLKDLIDNVLEMAKIESGKVSVELQPCNLNSFANGIVAVFEGLLKDKSLTLDMQMDVSHPFIYLDETQTRRIYHNIISNAVKYTPCGGKITVRCRQIMAPDGKSCFIETVVQDTGIGMSEEFLKKATEPFSRAQGSSRNIVGTGLGLAITKSLVDVMKGTLTIESQMGVGSTITISLPHELAADPETKQECKVQKKEDLKGLRFLLAEDNDIDAE
ncbi:MAG: hypothetical protein KBS81_02350 [Spirochaetales bacterium]|nr:hypothetical protein [Candidatus Physcosoma equi]